MTKPEIAKHLAATCEAKTCRLAALGSVTGLQGDTESWRCEACNAEWTVTQRAGGTLYDATGAALEEYPPMIAIDRSPAVA